MPKGKDEKGQDTRKKLTPEERKAWADRIAADLAKAGGDEEEEEQEGEK